MTNTNLNAKINARINEYYRKMPSITILVSATSLTVVEIKIRDVSHSVKRTD